MQYYVQIFTGVPPATGLDCLDTDTALTQIQRSVTIPPTIFDISVVGGIAILNPGSTASVEARMMPLVLGDDYTIVDNSGWLDPEVDLGLGTIVLQLGDGDPLTGSSVTLTVISTYAPQDPTATYSLRENVCALSLSSHDKVSLAAGMTQAVDGVLETLPVIWEVSELYSTSVDVRWLQPFVLTAPFVSPFVGFSLAADRPCYVADGQAVVAELSPMLANYVKSSTEYNTWYSSETVPYFGQNLPRYRVTVRRAGSGTITEERSETFFIGMPMGNMVASRPQIVTRTATWSL